MKTSLLGIKDLIIKLETKSKITAIPHAVGWVMPWDKLFKLQGLIPGIAFINAHNSEDECRIEVN